MVPMRVSEKPMRIPEKMSGNAAGNSTKNVYVQSVKVNGSTQRNVSIDSSVLAHGGTIDFKMGPNPSTWGTGAKDSPASLTTGTAQAVAAVRQDELALDRT